MIYVPNLENYKCVVISNNETIRAYTEVPSYNSDINYTDYYIHTDYYWNSGVQHFSNYTTLPTCISSDRLTSNTWYRVDMPSIFGFYLGFIGFFFVLVVLMFKAFFRGFA